MNPDSNDDVKVPELPGLKGIDPSAGDKKGKKKPTPETGWEKKPFIGLLIWSVLIPFFGWFIGLKNGFKGKKLAKQAWTLFGVSTLAFVVFLNVFGGGGNDYKNVLVKTLKGHSFYGHPEITVGDAVESLLANANWEVIYNTDDSHHYVNVRGKMSFRDKPVDALMQFKMAEGWRDFSITGLEFNGIPQNELMLTAVLQKMVGSGK